MTKRALLVIDMLNDFIEPGAAFMWAGRGGDCRAIAQEVRRFREAGEPVILSVTITWLPIPNLPCSLPTV